MKKNSEERRQRKKNTLKEIILEPGMMTQVDLCEFNANLAYIVSSGQLSYLLRHCSSAGSSAHVNFLRGRARREWMSLNKHQYLCKLQQVEGTEEGSRRQHQHLIYHGR